MDHEIYLLFVDISNKLKEFEQRFSEIELHIGLIKIDEGEKEDGESDTAGKE